MLDELSIKLRRVTAEDCQLLFRWANDPVMRSMAFSVDPICWEEHCKWFEKKLRDDNCTIYIASTENNQPVGQIRFDATIEQEAQVSISVAAGMRGRGIGALLIERGVERLFQETSIQVVHALIKAENLRSINAFTRAGFVKQAEPGKQSAGTVHLVKSRSEA